MSILTTKKVTLINKKEMWLAAAKILRGAVEVMNDGGTHWTKGTLHESVWDSETSDGVDEALNIERYCVTGGLNKAADLPQVYGEQYRVNTYLPETGKSVASYKEGDAPAGGSGAESANFTAEDHDKLVALDAAKYALAQVLRGETVDLNLNPLSRGYSELAGDESFIISFNDDKSTYIEDGDVRTEVPREMSWQRISAALNRAANAAENNAEYASDTPEA